MFQPGKLDMQLLSSFCCSFLLIAENHFTFSAISGLQLMYYPRCSKKPLFYIFANISANTYSRETSRISTELPWEEVSNDMRLTLLRYLVHEKIEILREILTLFERTITPLQVHAF